MTNNSGYGEAIHVDPWVHHLGRLVEYGGGLWRRLGGWETRLLSDALSGVSIEQPVYISGLARSGTTKLLELLDGHPEVVTHRYRDFPLLHIPYLWNRFVDLAPQRSAGLTERAHRDGILVGPDSPEAFEEVLWMSFFATLHDPAQSSVLDGNTENSGFEAFYKDHIRKLLLVREGRRYASKGNYNITRLEYLLKIFPAARFLIPVRDPVWHIASLMKQHNRFRKALERNPRAVRHLQRAGHFEFGPDRRPINAGDSDEVREIQELWRRGRDVEAWARYWRHIYAYVADRLAHNPALADAALVVCYEELCRKPAATVRRVLEHCRLPVRDELLEGAEAGLHFPDYYQPRFSEQELEIIERWTGVTAARLGPAHGRQPAAGGVRPAHGDDAGITRRAVANRRAC